MHLARTLPRSDPDVVQSVGGTIDVSDHGQDPGVRVASLEDRYAELYQAVAQLQRRLNGNISRANRRLPASLWRGKPSAKA